MRSKVVASGLSIVLGLAGVSAILQGRAFANGFPEVAAAQSVEARKAEALRLLQQGIQQYQSKQTDAALQSILQSLSIYREIRDRKSEGLVLLLLGTYDNNPARQAKKFEYLEQALVIARELKERENEGIILAMLGASYSSLENRVKALEYLEPALVIARERKDQKLAQIILGSLGLAYISLRNYDRAVEYLESSLVIARELKDGNSEMMILPQLGTAYSYIGDMTNAIKYLEPGLSLAREKQDKSGEILALIGLGNSNLSLDRYEKSIEYYQQSLTIARVEKNQLLELLALGGLGGAYANLGNYDKAIEFHEQSLTIARESKNRLMEGYGLNNLGSLYATLGDYPRAIDNQKKGLAIMQEIKSRQSEGIVLSSLGSTHYSTGNYDESMKYYQQSLEISREFRDKSLELRSLGGIGIAYFGLKNYTKGIEYQEQSLVASRIAKSTTGEGYALGHLGQNNQGLGNYTKAIDYYRQGLTLAKEINYPEGQRLALDRMASAWKAQKKPELAITFYKQSVNIAESLRKNVRKLPREAQEIYTSSIASTYRVLADLLLTQGRSREAQSILELLKVQEASGYEKAQETNSSIVQLPLHPIETQALQAFEKTIASKQPLTAETLNPIEQPLTQNRDRITQDMNAMPIAIGNPQAVLKANPNALLIQNLVINDKLWVLWTNASGNTKAIVVPNVKQTQLDETVKTFRSQIGDPRSNLNTLKATSTQLYNWLIPTELQAELKNNPKQQLLFSLDHVTRYIPVAALYDGNQYLAQRYTLSNLITVDIDVRDRLSPDGSAPTILGLGTTQAYPGFSELPNVKAELKAIVKDNTDLGIYPGKIQLDNAFTANSLSQNLDPYRVLHIATHGSFNPKSITASFLLLGNGDRLPITSIASLKNLTNTHLVVLSACETGLSGAGQDGTEISGIGGYFLRRGAKSVLASLWSVNDASTALLMQQFYQNLSQSKLTKAQSLQKVQQDFISGKFTAKEATTIRAVRPYIEGQAPPDSFVHPYFWAPFTLTGNPN